MTTCAFSQVCWQYSETPACAAVAKRKAQTNAMNLMTDFMTIYFLLRLGHAVGEDPRAAEINPLVAGNCDGAQTYPGPVYPTGVLDSTIPRRTEKVPDPGGSVL